MTKRTYNDCDYWYDEKATGDAFLEQLNTALAMGDFPMVHLLEYGRWPRRNRFPDDGDGWYKRFQRKL